MLAVLMATGAAPVFAQSQASTGQIVGTVTDKQGAALTGATVKITNTQTGLEQTVTTNEEGAYKAVLLPSGIYTVTVEASGFANATISNVEVAVGRTVTSNVMLDPSGVQEVVNVTAGTIQVQTTRSEADSIVDERAIANLPINGRRFQDFVTLTPTAQVDPQRNQISLAGQRGIYGANVNVDGADYNQPFFGGIRGGERSNSAFTLPQESIKEFQVVAAGYTAEFGRSTGGLVNAVTKSGTNAYHGTAFYLLRHRNFSVKNEFFETLEDQVNLTPSPDGSTGRRTIKPSPTQQQFGGSVGGPIKKDKLFFFGAIEFQNVEQKRQSLFPDLIGLPVTENIREAFDFLQSQQGEFATTNDAFAGLIRFDWELNSNHRFNIRYNLSRNSADNANATGNQLFPTTISALTNNGTERDRTHTVVGQLASFFTSNMVNELRGQYSYERRPRESNSELPTFTTNQARWGAVSFLPTTQYDWRVQISDNITWTHGNHTLKLGGEYNHTFADQLFGFNQFGAYSLFQSVVNTLDILSFSPGFVPPAGTTTTLNRFDTTQVSYLIQIGNRVASYSVDELAFFAQDSWRIQPNFTLNFGLRWEGQYNPDPEVGNDALINKIQGFRFPSGHVVDPTKINSSTNQFGPRVGFAWDPWGDTRTVIRGFGGVYYARTPMLLFSTPINNFTLPPGDVSVRLPLAIPAGNPNASQNTIYKQLKLIGIDLNNAELGNLPTITPENVTAIAQALGLSVDPFLNANVTLVAPDFKNPRSYQAGIGIERQINNSLTVGADFSYINTVYLQRNRELNLPLPGRLAGDPALRPFFGLRGAAGRPAIPRPIPTLGSIQQRESTGKSLYRALTFRMKFQKKWGQFNAFYTLSKSLSDDDNERDAGGVSVENAFDYGPEYGPARLDRRHQFVANPVFFLPHGFDVSGAIRLRSGRPLDSFVGFDANEDIAGPDRPFLAPGIPFTRNSFRNRALSDFDLRVQKHFPVGEGRRLTFSAEIFNLFNLNNIEISNDSQVTNFCIPQPPSTVIPRDCGFFGPTNPNFAQIRDRRPTSPATNGDLLLINNPVSGSFQMQLGARFQF
jgi:hypothetical protein